MKTFRISSQVLDQQSKKKWTGVGQWLNLLEMEEGGMSERARDMIQNCMAPVKEEYCFASLHKQAVQEQSQQQPKQEAQQPSQDQGQPQEQPKKSKKAMKRVGACNLYAGSHPSSSCSVCRSSRSTVCTCLHSGAERAEDCDL